MSEPKTIHWVATIGSTTAHGGRISKVSSGAEFYGFKAALVGDTVTYDDGTEATILDGSEFCATWANTPFALVGSRLSNTTELQQRLNQRSE
jgi:uncharacterized Zn-binding protein involved in type VI secretion